MGSRFSRIEDTANGATACQLMDALHPGVVPMKKVDCNAKNEYDMVRVCLGYVQRRKEKGMGVQDAALCQFEECKHLCSVYSMLLLTSPLLSTHR